VAVVQELEVVARAVASLTVRVVIALVEEKTPAEIVMEGEVDNY